MKQDIIKEVGKAIRWGLKKNRTIYVGIDPGSQGAIGLVVGKRAYAISLPTIKVKRGKGNKTEFVLQEIVDIFRRLAAYHNSGNEVGVGVALERPLVHTGGFQVKNKFGNMRTAGRGGAFSAQRQGENYGMWPLYLTSLNLVPNILVPHVWKKKMGLTKNKDHARRIAMKLFPNLKLPFKKDHDKAEAVLMALHLRRLLSGA